MICYIQGKILEINPNTVEILTENGVGYELHINEKIFSQHFWKENTHFFVYHHKTENSESLFAFSNRDEKTIFKELIKISGVWGKVAMQILSLGNNDLLNAVQNDDQKTIQTIKGVGKKMSEKIILELKDKNLGIAIDNSQTSVPVQQKVDTSIQSELSNTLKNMGYQADAIEKAFAKLPEWLNDAGEILPLLIKELG